MKTLCVTGGNGLLGSKLIQAAEGRYRMLSIDCQDAPVTLQQHVTYVRADITRKEVIYDAITRHKPDGIIHAAAMTHVDGCETEPDRAREVNAGGTENVALAARDLNVKMIHVSTDYVFDGKSGPYAEDDPVNPISVYGRTKLEGERIVQQLLKNCAIARTMVLYGYVPTIRLNYVTWLIDALGKGQTVSIVTDQYGTPTLADDLADALLVLFEKNGTGVYHTAGSGVINRYDMARQVAEIFGYNLAMIKETTSDRLKQPAPRPLRSGLKTDKIKREMGVAFSTSYEGIACIKKQMAQNHPGM